MFTLEIIAFIFIVAALKAPTYEMAKFWAIGCLIVCAFRLIGYCKWRVVNIPNKKGEKKDETVVEECK